VSAWLACSAAPFPHCKVTSASGCQFFSCNRPVESSKLCHGMARWLEGRHSFTKDTTTWRPSWRTTLGNCFANMLLRNTRWLHQDRPCILTITQHPELSCMMHPATDAWAEENNKFGYVLAKGTPSRGHHMAVTLGCLTGCAACCRCAWPSCPTMAAPAVICQRRLGCGT
jgi:hypothetical protein